MVVYKVVMPLRDPVARKAYDKRRYYAYKTTPEERKKAIAYQQIYRVKKREEIKAKRKQRHKDHRDEIAIRDKLYYEKNKDKIKAKTSQYQKDHPEVNLKAKKKELIKLGKTFDMDCDMFKYAIMSWSKTVRKRDNNKCTRCNSTKTLVSHHIWHKAFCPESALDVDNGITLCHDCHMEQHRLDRL